MENAFNLSYGKEVDKLEIKEKRKNKILNIIKKHKFISAISIIFIIFSIINFYLIFSFIKILGNI